MSQYVALIGAVVVAFWSMTGQALASTSERLPTQVNNLVPVLHDGVLVVQFQSGTYVLTHPIDVSQFSQGKIRAPVLLKGAEGGRTRVAGSRVYRPRRPRPDESLPERLTNDPTLLVIDADDDIRRLWRDGKEMSLGCGKETIVELFQDGRRLNCARWPKTGFAHAKTVLNADPKALSFIAPSLKVEDWTGAQNFSISGYFGQDWLYETGTVTSVDSIGTVRLGPLQQTYKPIAGFRYVVRGAPADLTLPGEYVSDPIGGRIFLRKFASADAQVQIEIPVGRTLLSVVDGTNVTIENIDFAMSWGDAITIKNSHGVKLRDISVEHAGGAGIVVQGGKNVVIENAIVTDIGSVGVSLGGGNRQTLEPAGHALRCSIITHTAVIDRTYHPAVALDGVGNSVEDSYIADLPHEAISFSGNDHRIAHNEITNVVNETSDAGAIYSGRDWTWRGTTIEKNYFHNIMPSAEPSLDIDEKGKSFPMEVKGVYFDDMLSGDTIEGNIFSDVDQPVFIGGGRDNHVLGNLFINPRRQAMFLDERGMSGPWATDPGSTIRQRLAAVPYSAFPYIDRYPNLATILESGPGEPRGNEFVNNITVGGIAFHFADTSETFAQTHDNVALADWLKPKDDELDGIVRTLPLIWPTNIPGTVRDDLLRAIDRLKSDRVLWARLNLGLFKAIKTERP